MSNLKIYRVKGRGIKKGSGWAIGRNFNKWFENKSEAERWEATIDWSTVETFVSDMPRSRRALVDLLNRLTGEW